MKTVRSDCGSARATFDPEGSPELPWAVYCGGQPSGRYALLTPALADLCSMGYSFRNTPEADTGAKQ